MGKLILLVYLYVCSTAFGAIQWDKVRAIGGPDLDNSAVFQINSTTKGSVAHPKMTTTQSNAISGPTEGLGVWDTSSKKQRVFNSTDWVYAVYEDVIQTLTNKSIDSDFNTITNIANANIKTGAAIARSKLAAGSASHVVINDPSGVMTSEATLAKVRGGTGQDNSSLTFPASGNLITDSSTDTLTNKTIDADFNSITNIANANIKTGAAIARNKLASGTANHVLINDGSGVMSSEATLAKSRGGSGQDNSSLTFPASGTLATLAGTEVFTNKDYDGGTASNTSRFTMAKAAKTTLDGLTRKEGTIHYATDTQKFYGDNGTTLSELGSGSGGGGYDVFYSENFESDIDSADLTSGNSATLSGGTLSGTLANETGAAVIAGTKSIKFTQAAGSLNDYFCSPSISLVGDKLKGNFVALKYVSKYNGGSTDIRALLYDVTNSATLGVGTEYVEASSISKANAPVFYIPTSTATVKWCFQVATLNSGKILYLDDVQITVDPFKYKTTVDTQYLQYSSAQTSFQDRSGELRFPSGLTTSNFVGPIILKVEDDSGSTRTKFTATRACQVEIGFSANVDGAHRLQVFKNGSQILAGNSSSTGAFAGVPGTVHLEEGEYLTFASSTSITNDGSVSYLLLSAKAPNENIVTPINSFYSLTAPLAFKATAIASTDPVGTFNTYSYAASTNTKTICGTAPTQTTADMSQNGMRIFARVFGSASTCGNPARIELKIGPGMRGVYTNIYKSTGLSTVGTIDFSVRDSTEEIGLTDYGYNEVTGVVTYDVGHNINTSTTTKRFQFSDVTSQTDGYLVTSAGGTPQLAAVPVPQICFLKDLKTNGTAGGTFTSGAWQTRTLNTTSGSCSFLTLSSNQITIGPGEYTFEGTAMAQQVDEHQTKIRSITDSSDVILGASVYAGSGAGNSNSPFMDKFTIASNKTYELQHRCTTTKATNGFGTAGSFGVGEVYAQMKIIKWR